MQVTAWSASSEIPRAVVRLGIEWRVYVGEFMKGMKVRKEAKEGEGH